MEVREEMDEEMKKFEELRKKVEIARTIPAFEIIGGYIMSIEDILALLADREQLREALINLQYGTDKNKKCWCDFSIGHPLYAEHSSNCNAASAALKKSDEVENG